MPHRFNMRLSEEDYSLLLEMERKTGDTRSECYKKAMRLYATMRGGKGK